MLRRSELPSRYSFWLRAAKVGSAWAWRITGHGLRVFALLGLSLGVAAGGVLLDRPAWFIGGFVALVAPQA